MRRPLRSLVAGTGVALLIAAALAAALGPAVIERQRNTVEFMSPPAVGAAASALHERIVIADLHADTLLWARDPLRRSGFGHVDVPRLIDANVAVQVFASVTQVPGGRNYERSGSDSDLIFWLGIVQRWPLATWTSNTERALFHARRLHTAAAESGGALTVIETADDLDAYLRRRTAEPNITAGLLAVEGLHALDGQLGNIDELYAAGYRIMGLAHFFDNDVAGSAHGFEQGGLTAFGREVLARMEALGIVVDLAHVSSRAFDETIERVTRPVVVSHTGVAGTCAGPRNLTDEQIRRVAATGGVIGIAFFEGTLCGIEPEDFARAARHVADLVGVAHVATGSDFDGTVHTKFDVTGLPWMTQALLEAGFSEPEVAQLMGGNVIRLLRASLPPLLGDVGDQHAAVGAVDER